MLNSTLFTYPDFVHRQWAWFCEHFSRWIDSNRLESNRLE